MSRIVLITPSHLTSNPRLVKEADALQAAGHDVQVIAGRYFPFLDSFDDAICAAAPWSCLRVNYANGLRTLLAKLRRQQARRELAAGKPATEARACDAHHIGINALEAAAARFNGDLYIGHCLAGLAAAGLAARRTGGRLGFDFEDLHSAETTEAEFNPVEIASIRAIEATWLPHCLHLTAASPLIGKAVATAHGIPAPLAILNTFPLSQAPPTPVPPESVSGHCRLYWFSQTIGPGRGLESLIQVLGRLRSPCSLQLRGLPANGFPTALRDQARSAGFTGSLEFSPIAPPHEMAALAASADLGLSLEDSTPRNRDLCLTNKIFTYLLAGVPVALTPTSAQSELAKNLGPAALMLDLEHPTAAALELDNWLMNPTRRATARAAAWRLGHEQYHWEREIPTLLNSVSRALSIPK